MFVTNIEFVIPKYLQPDFVDHYYFKLCIQIMHFNKPEFEMSKVLPLGCKVIGIGKFEFVAKTLLVTVRFMTTFGNCYAFKTILKTHYFLLI